MNELTIDGKTYVSSKRAAEITGYAKDYVGQLCREGRVNARLVGRAWYVLESSIREHRFGASEAAPEPAKEEKPTIVDAWASLRYEAEPVVEEVVPVVEKPSVNVFSPSYGTVAEEEAPAEEPQRLTDSLADLQSAWKDWFSRKETADTGSEPQNRSENDEEENRVEDTDDDKSGVEDEIIGAGDDHGQESEEEEAEEADEAEEAAVSEEVRVPIERIRVRTQYRTPEIEAATEEAVVVEERVVRRRRKRRAHPVAYAALSLVCIVAAGIATLGTGIADHIVTNSSLAAVELISGVSSVSK
jgi:hypothetical protein